MSTTSEDEDKEIVSKLIMRCCTSQEITDTAFSKP